MNWFRVSIMLYVLGAIQALVLSSVARKELRLPRDLSWKLMTTAVIFTWPVFMLFLLGMVLHRQMFNDNK